MKKEGHVDEEISTGESIDQSIKETPRPKKVAEKGQEECVIDQLVGITNTLNLISSSELHHLLLHLHSNKHFHTSYLSRNVEHFLASPLLYPPLYYPLFGELEIPVQDRIVEEFLKKVEVETGVEYNSVSVFRVPDQTEGEINLTENCYQRDNSFPVFVFSFCGRFTVRFRGCDRGKRPQKILPEREVQDNCGVTIRESVLGRYDLNLKWGKSSQSQYLCICRVVLESLDENEATEVLYEDLSVSKSVILNGGVISPMFHRKSEGTEKIHDENDRAEIPHHTKTNKVLGPYNNWSNATDQLR